MIFVKRSYAGVIERSCSVWVRCGGGGGAFFKAPICEITKKLFTKFILIKT